MGISIIFDMDGTLLDSRVGITRAINFVRASRSLEPVSSDEVVRVINDETISAARYFYGVDEYTARDRELFEGIYWEICTQELVLYDGIGDLLEEIRRSGAMMAVATNASSRFARKMIDHVGIGEYFTHILGYNDVAASKPAPDMLQAILADHRPKVASFMVGDSIKDMKAARAAGVQGVLAKWGYTPEVSSYDHPINHPRELLDLIQKGIG
ncbi:MAG: HAD family hydrolase [Campylobacterales bacterium]